MNLYQYVQGRSIIQRDPFGLDPCLSERLNLQAAEAQIQTGLMGLMACGLTEDPLSAVICAIIALRTLDGGILWKISACIALNKCEQQNNLPLTLCDGSWDDSGPPRVRSRGCNLDMSNPPLEIPGHTTQPGEPKGRAECEAQYWDNIDRCNASSCKNKEACYRDATNIMAYCLRRPCGS